MAAFSFTAMAATFSSTASSKPTFTLWQTLAEALRLLRQSCSLSLPLLFFSILSSSLLFLSNFLSVAPIATDLFANLRPFLAGGPQPPFPAGPDLRHLLVAIFDDLRRLVITQTPFFLAALLHSLLLLIAAVHIFSAAYCGQPLTVESLLKKIKTRWYQTLITQLYIILLTIGLTIISTAGIADVLIIWGESPSTARIAGILLASTVALYAYLRTRWSMSQVITVVEKKETYGIGALSWAVELYVGNARRGTMLTVLDLAVSGGIAAAQLIAVASADADEDKQIKISAVMVAADATWSLFMAAVYTVFYYECRKSFGLAVVEEEDDEILPEDTSLQVFVLRYFSQRRLVQVFAFHHSVITTSSSSSSSSSLLPGKAISPSSAMAKELGVLGILRESSLALLINAKLILPTAFFLLIPLKLLQNNVPRLNPPLSLNLTSAASLIAPSLGLPKPKKFVLTLTPLGLVFSNLISSSNIYLSVLACTGSHFGLSEIVAKIKRTWRWLALTLLQTNLITHIFGILWSVVEALTNSMTTNEDSDFLLLGGLLVFIGAAGLMLYLVLLTKVSEVVAVMEEGCYGLDALARANELMRRRKLKLFLLTGLLSVMAKGVDVLAGILVRGGGGERRRSAAVAAEVARRLPVWVIGTLIGIFRSVVLGVYYLECKKGVGRRRSRLREGGSWFERASGFEKADAAINAS
ncbi:hypothetical protein AXF42_Ash018566 [Apostasia shenzhenica]|uniref:Uncharacterized protein n=1 Tax=Apostasia shenzhenica TaxID=1088818 RepID=A0A2I0APW2_9ASPA|nr:hypothetical protein AXF42_Ash018566 [Apostasia shenzhenica]